MSTVRMSDYLRRDICRAFEESHKKSKPEMELDVARGDAIYNEYIGPKVEQVQTALADTFGNMFDTNQMFSKKNTLQCIVPLNVTRHYGGDTETELDEEYALQVPLSTERLVPMGIDQGSYNNYTKEIRWSFDRYENKDLNYLCECVEYNYKIRALREQSKNKVDGLLRKFTTLNQALKAWPALSKLVEPEKLAKVHEKQQRKRKQEQQKEIADQVVLDNDLNKTILSASLIGDE